MAAPYPPPGPEATAPPVQLADDGNVVLTFITVFNHLFRCNIIACLLVRSIVISTFKIHVHLQA